MIEKKEPWHFNWFSNLSSFEDDRGEIALWAKSTVSFATSSVKCPKLCFVQSLCRILTLFCVLVVTVQFRGMSAFGPKIHKMPRIFLQVPCSEPLSCKLRNYKMLAVLLFSPLAVATRFHFTTIYECLIFSSHS